MGFRKGSSEAGIQRIVTSLIVGSLSLISEIKNLRTLRCEICEYWHEEFEIEVNPVQGLIPLDPITCLDIRAPIDIPIIQSFLQYFYQTKAIILRNTSESATLGYLSPVLHKLNPELQHLEILEASEDLVPGIDLSQEILRFRNLEVLLISDETLLPMSSFCCLRQLPFLKVLSLGFSIWMHPGFSNPLRTFLETAPRTLENLNFNIRSDVGSNILPSETRWKDFSMDSEVALEILPLITRQLRIGRIGIIELIEVGRRNNIEIGGQIRDLEKAGVLDLTNR